MVHFSQVYEDQGLVVIRVYAWVPQTLTLTYLHLFRGHFVLIELWNT